MADSGKKFCRDATTSGPGEPGPGLTHGDDHGSRLERQRIDALVVHIGALTKRSCNGSQHDPLTVAGDAQ
jgi:hypothetical protein